MCGVTCVLGSKWVQSLKLDTVNRSLCYLCALALWAGVTYLHYTVLISLNKDETAVHCCNPSLLALFVFGVSKLLSCSISIAVYCLQK